MNKTPEEACVLRSVAKTEAGCIRVHSGLSSSAPVLVAAVEVEDSKLLEVAARLIFGVCGSVSFVSRYTTVIYIAHRACNFALSCLRKRQPLPFLLALTL